jgi:hypothetical protein
LSGARTVVIPSPTGICRSFWYTIIDGTVDHRSSAAVERSAEPALEYLPCLPGALRASEGMIPTLQAQISQSASPSRPLAGWAGGCVGGDAFFFPPPSLGFCPFYGTRPAIGPLSKSGHKPRRWSEEEIESAKCPPLQRLFRKSRRILLS